MCTFMQSIQTAGSTYALHSRAKSSTSLRSETAPQVFTHLGHTVADYLYSQGISVIPYLDDWLIHHSDHQSQLPKSLDLVGFKLNKEKSNLDLIQDIQFLKLQGIRGEHYSQNPRLGI